MSFDVAPMLGCRTSFLESSQINSQRDMHLEAGLVLDARWMTPRRLTEWVSDWRRIDPDWPVVMVVGAEQEDLAYDALEHGVMNYMVWASPENTAASAWMATQVRKMLEAHVPPDSLQWNGVCLNAHDRTLIVGDKSVVLNTGEALIMGKLLAAAGEVVHRTEMARTLAVARLAHGGMAAHLYRLRKALRQAKINRVVIKSSRLGGYWVELTGPN
jgi:DNA-binding response OmpR family regulator